MQLGAATLTTLGTVIPGIPTVDPRPKARTLRDQIVIDSRSVFMSGMAQPVSWQPTGEPSSIINAIFEAPTPTLDMVHGVAILMPTLICASADVPRAKHGDQIVVNRKAYWVHNVRDDGTGITTLELSEDQDGR